MNGLLCLKWNNHSTAFYKTLSSHRSKELYCDATIVCHGKYFPVHRFVLTVCSEYFSEIFERTKCRHPFIILKDIESSEVEALLNYMYKGEVNVLQDLLPGLIKAAEALKIKGLAVPDDEDYNSVDDEIEPCTDRKRSHNCSLTTNTKRSCKAFNKNVSSNETSSSQTNQVNSNHIDQSSKCSGIEASSKINDQNKKSVLLDQNHLNLKLLQNNESNIGLNEDPTLDMGKCENLDTNDVKVEPIEFCEDSDQVYLDDDDPFDSENERSLFQTLLSSDDLSSTKPKIKNSNEPLAQCSSWNKNLNHSSENSELGPNLEKFTDMHDRLSNTKIQIEEFLTLYGSKKQESKTILSRQCPYCSYQSKILSHLKRHIICKHTQERPYKCEFCPYKTGHGSNLKMHIMTHTGEKPYSCNICSYRATRNDCIIKHMKLHNK